MKIKKGDMVKVIAGKDKGKTGKVLRTYPKDNKVVGEGVNVQTKHAKATRNTPAEIKHIEGPIDASNVMLVCPKCGKATRVGKRVAEDGSKFRVCKKCGADIDQIKKAKEE